MAKQVSILAFPQNIEHHYIKRSQQSTKRWAFLKNGGRRFNNNMGFSLIYPWMYTGAIYSMLHVQDLWTEISRIDHARFLYVQQSAEDQAQIAKPHQLLLNRSHQDEK